MITLTAKINLLGSDGVEIEGISTYDTKINISSEIDSIKGVISQKVVNPFMLGISEFGDDDALYNKLGYFVSASSSEFIFNVTSSSNISFLTIEFDTKNDRYPEYVYISGTKYYPNSSVWTVDVEDSDYLTITLSDDYYPVVLAGIYTDVTISLDYKSLISVSRTIYDRSDIKLPKFGVFSNIANLEFNDFSADFLNYAEQNLLVGGLDCTLFLNNTIIGQQQTIGVFKTDQWQYDNDSRLVSLSLKDELEEWQNIHIDGFSYDARVQESKTLKEYYNYLHDRTPAKYNMLAFDLLDDATKSVLTDTIVRYPLLESGSLWQQWDKLANAAQSHIFKRNDGKTTFVYNGGN